MAAPRSARPFNLVRKISFASKRSCSLTGGSSLRRNVSIESSKSNAMSSIVGRAVNSSRN